MRGPGLAAVALWLSLAGIPFASGTAPETPAPGKEAMKVRNRVVLLALDGATLPTVRELVVAGRLPGFAQVIELGATGRLASLYRELPFSPARGGGYWSPIVWNSVATGKPPEIHGVIDFRLPDPARVRLCTKPGATAARVRVPRNGVTAVAIDVHREPAFSGQHARLDAGGGRCTARRVRAGLRR